jgi:S-DNA-T family DNA segregation ATPase FtsK/SpoIIIE
VDKTQAWRVTRRYAKTAAEWTGEKGRWSAEKWGAEADRRKAKRAELKPLVTDAKRAVAVARRDDPERKKAATHRAERELRQARRAVPDTLLGLATKVLAGLGVLAWWGLPRVPAEVWRWTAITAVAAAVGGVGWLAYQIAKAEEAAPELEPTAEEKQLLARLQPKHWREHCEGRGLAGTLTGDPVLSVSGVAVNVRLDGTWTATKLRQAADHVRALLGCRTSLRLEIKAGERGGWARMILRTRSAADGDDLLWSPEKRTFGVDIVTGEQVEVPLGERMVIAGMSGAGKSVASRPLMFDASEGDTNALVIFDLKKVEGRLWDHRARVASTPEDAIGLAEELVEEMNERLDLLPKGQDKWTPTAERPRITVVVDEGAEIVTAAKKGLGPLESIARMGRAAAIDLWWMTQKPTIPDGIPKQIAPQLALKICLAVSTPTEARVVLGEDAQAKGWNAEDLDYPGYAFVRGGKSRKPHPVKVRYMDKAQIIALPERPIWSYGAEPPAPTRPALTLLKGDGQPGPNQNSALPAPIGLSPLPDQPPTIPAPALQAEPATNRDQVLAAVRAGARTAKEVTEATGLNKGTVSREIKALVQAKVVLRAEDGTLATAAGEVSA